MNNSQRSYLKGKAHHLDPIIYIGRKGLSEDTLYSIRIALAARELIKIKFHGFNKESIQEISKKITIKTLSFMVGSIGHTLILFKQNSNSEKQKYQLP